MVVEVLPQGNDAVVHMTRLVLNDHLEQRKPPTNDVDALSEIPSTLAACVMGVDLG